MPRISTSRYAPAQTEVIRDIVRRASGVYGHVPRVFSQSEADAAVRCVVQGLHVDETTIEEAVDAFEQFLEDQKAAEDFDRGVYGDWWPEDDFND